MCVAPSGKDFGPQLAGMTVSNLFPKENDLGCRAETRHLINPFKIKQSV
jgi:hypothetical protein